MLLQPGMNPGLAAGADSVRSPILTQEHERGLGAAVVEVPLQRREVFQQLGLQALELSCGKQHVLHERSREEQVAPDASSGCLPREGFGRVRRQMFAGWLQFGEALPRWPARWEWSS